MDINSKYVNELKVSKYQYYLYKKHLKFEVIKLRTAVLNQVNF